MRILVGLMVAVALAGCTDGSASNGVDSSGSGQEATADGYVFRNGVSNAGITESDPFDCDGSATVDGYINGAGHVIITVEDAAGVTKSTMTVNGSGQDFEDRTVSGTAGDWSIKVDVRAGNQYYPQGFSGQYEMSVTC